MIDFIRTPWAHQLAAAERARDLRDYALFMEPGVGKSLCAIMICRQKMADSGKAMRVLVICPPIVLKNWREEWLQASKFTMDQVRFTKGSGIERAQIFLPELMVAITNYESLLMAPVLTAVANWQPSIIIYDECFIHGTLVDTPNGPVPIQNIRVGDIVLNALGEGVVTDTFKKFLERSVYVNFLDRSIECSESHLWFTQRGWVEARHLKGGDILVRTEEAVRLLRKTFLSEQGSKDQAFLRKILLGEVENASTRNSPESIYSRGARENGRQTFGAKKSRALSFAKNKEPNVRSRNKGEGQRYSPKNQAWSKDSWWKWNRPNSPRETSARPPGHCLQMEPYDKTRRKTKRTSDFIQSGFSFCRRQISDRGGRILSLCSNSKVSGPKKRREIEGIRVESISYSKCGSSQRPGQSYFYDLEVSGHPSYSVSNVLVHNCHRLKNYKAKRTKNAIKLSRLPCVKHRYILSGTPVLNSPMDLFTQFLAMDLGETFGKDRNIFLGTYFWDKNQGFKGSPKYFPDYRIYPDSLGKITALIEKKSVHVKKAECLTLPPFVRKKIYVQLSPEQRRLYKEMADDFVAYSESGTAVARLALTKALRLQQIVSGFLTVEDPDNAGSSRLHEIAENPRKAAAEELLSDLTESGKTLVWCCFRQDYKTIREICEKIGVKYVELTGDTTQSDRFKAVEAFDKQPDIKICIANPAASGLGINLVAASSSLYFSRSFSLEHDLQSSARNFRGGSGIHDRITRYDLIAEFTIDELILRKLEDKEAISESILRELVLEVKNGLSEISGRASGRTLPGGSSDRGTRGRALETSGN